MNEHRPTDPRLAADLPAVFEAVFLPAVDSVLEEIRRRKADGAEEGLLVWTETQAQGHGQHGPWASPPGGLYCGILLEPDFPRERWPELGLVAVLALGTVTAELLPPLTGLDYGWPNDVLVNGHKVGGIALHGAGEDGLVILAHLNVAPPVEGWEYASLVADGAADTTPGEALGRYAAYLLDGLQRWHDEGLAAIARSLRARGLRNIDPQSGGLIDPEQTLAGFFAEVCNEQH
ncbi:biotin--[acetyl-CoA-carboxylase] ligase [Spiribacter pallidus]|uniref:biotin--[acetyl-CoA-carboxylase] ligase n=1 Tax=Spiribacter pallidus TaxID=1987936 RepID=UPI0034A01FCF